MEGWEELGFEEGKDFVGFQGVEEMCEQVKWCLENPVERETIARSGHTKVREHHTYVHRMKKILEVCGVEVGQNGNLAVK